jgi:hypothetical protein
MEDAMSLNRFRLALLALVLAPAAFAAQATQVTPPQPTVPEVFTIQGQYVRIAYNNQGYASLGYRLAQQSIGEDWIMLEVGLTMRRPAKNYTLTRKDLSIKTPDGTIIPLATQKEFAEAGYLTSLHMRAKVIRDSINYFPVDAHRGCAIQFFAILGQGPRQVSFDEVELSSDRACLGRLYFHVPGGTKVGQYWLNVSFGESVVQVPFRLLTKEEAKEFEDSWEDIKKAHEDAMKQ